MSEKVFIESIQVENLFNRFTYDIDLRNGENIAILIAPNGCGKTTIFNLIDFIFNPSIEGLKVAIRTPFDRFKVVLSDGKSVELTVTSNDDPKQEKLGRPMRMLRSGLGLSRMELEGKVIYLTVEDGEKHPPIDLVTLFKTKYGIVFDDVDVEDISDTVLKRLADRVEREFRNELQSVFEEYHCITRVNYISADRLHKITRFNKADNYREMYFARRTEETPLKVIRNQMRDLFFRTDDAYKKLLSEARDKLPRMYLDAKDSDVGDLDSFKREWEQYVEDMRKYYELGLVDSTQTVLETDQLDEAFSRKGSFLTEYLKAFKPTLDPWEGEYQRLKLFADILNKRNEITHKKIKYGPDGIVITVDGQNLPLDCLSSGEKNDLVMFYNLIFNSEEGGIVLIDEPEISLHIEWQQEYLDRLLEICKMNELHAIVATHSPSIINGHFELYPKRGLQNVKLQ